MSTEDTARKIRRLLATEGGNVKEQTQHSNQRRYDAVAGLDDYDAVKARARAIKEDVVERLPELVDEVTERVEENGGTVYVADDVADANQYIQNVVAENDAETVVKSKSMTSEEIDVNEHIEDAGADVYETDLGEFVIQVADESPSHIVGPAMHKSREEIARLFNDRFEPDHELETAQELTQFARDYLGERIRDADIGMTGANFVVAESGTIALVTNEGNARKCAVTPDTHIALAGIEKFVPTFEELQPFVELIARSGTGQDLTSYVSMLTPPVTSPTVNFDADEETAFDAGGDREFHLILLDNGRSDLRDDPELRETLYCIRCGACANSCANFQHVGGHAFGGETYSGGIATGWEAGVHGQDSAAEFNDLCTGCTRCVNQCPVKIDIPWINTVVRDRVNHEDESGNFDFLVDGLTPDAEEGTPLGKRFFGNFATVARVGSAFAPVSNAVADSWPVRAAMERWLGIDARRDLPSFQRETLRKWMNGRDGLDPVDANREVVLYPDTYTNYVNVERGKAAVRTLEALGVAVRVPAVPESGRAPLSQGMVATARDAASDVYSALSDHLSAERDVVVIEPSDLAMFQRDYEKLLPEAEYETLAANSYEIMEYVYGLLDRDADRASALQWGEGEEVAYHSHCQQRTLGSEEYTVAVLEDIGFDVLTSDVECCGMAGSFGYKSEYYELSIDVGESLAAQFETDDARDRMVVASGTSCHDQLDELLARTPTHPIEVVSPEANSGS